MSRSALSFVCFILIAVSSFAMTLNVPSEYETIQDAINWANNGDIVLVANGIYSGDGNRDIDFLGKNIVVKSKNGARTTIIDCEGTFPEPHRGFYLHNDENNNAVIQGFTIKNGYAPGEHPLRYGGAIYCEGSSPTIRSNKIINNFAFWFGGGIACWESNARIHNNRIIENEGHFQGGGGIYIGKSNVVIGRNLIKDNITSWHGGGMYLDRSSAIIQNNIIALNQCGVGSYHGSGGGIFHYDCDTNIRNNLIAQNVANECGAGIFCQYFCNLTLNNNTVTENSGGYAGSGLFMRLHSNVDIVNSIFWGNTAPAFPEIYISDPLYSHLTVSYSNITGGYPGLGNLNEDPLFIHSSPYFYYLSQEPCQPQNSPCIDMGNPLTTAWGSTRTDHYNDIYPIDMGFHYWSQP